MQGYNCIILYDREEKHILLCKRRKNPYQGLSNFPGGKIEPGESGFEAAYRELYEETHISPAQTRLSLLMTFTYALSNCYVEVYVGKLHTDVPVYGEENELYWSDLHHNFFDPALYAGEGFMGHALMQVDLYKNTCLGERSPLSETDNNTP